MGCGSAACGADAAEGRAGREEYLELPEALEGEEITWDYASTGVSLRRHPLQQQSEAVGGTIFVSMEDEAGAVQVIVWKRVGEKHLRMHGQNFAVVYGLLLAQ